MSNLCIPKFVADSFKKALKGKDIQIGELLKMSTEERTKLFEKYAGTDAKTISTLFEEKLVLKNKVAGLKNFINQITMEGKYNPERKAELEQAINDYRAKQQERIFSPSEEQTFLNDLADKINGTHITLEESKQLWDLTSKVDDLAKNFDNTKPTGEKWSSPEKAREYGASKVAMDNYVESLKEPPQTLKQIFKDTINETKDTFKTNKPKAVGDILKKTLQTITDNSVALVASIDNSFMGRQGLKTLMTHPSVWWDGAKNSFTDIAGTLGGKNMKDALMADIYSKENYLNGNYDLAKILPKSEEQYPTSLPERIWGLGKAFKASEVAFTGSAIRMRTGLYDLVSNIAEKNGVEMNKAEIQSIGKMINSLTARGQWGKTGEPAVVRMILWSPKMLKANLDVLTAHTGQDISPFARKQAAINLAKIVMTSATIMTIANAIKPGSAETDPRSTNFGKVKVGNTTFDFTGGASSLLVLASRLLSGSSKSSSTGLVTQFGSGYGQQSRFDTLIDFLTNKTTPPVGAIISFLKGTTPSGQKATLKNVVGNITTPISIQNAINLKDDHSAEAVLGVLLDTIGINANTYNAGATDWTLNPGVELQAFQSKVGDVKFKEANDLYNTKVKTWLEKVKTDSIYKQMSPEDKQKIITRKKGDIKNEVLKQYGFIYKAPKTKKLPKF